MKAECRVAELSVIYFGERVVYSARMANLKGFDDFEQCIHAAMEETLRPLIERGSEPLGRAIRNHVLDLPGPTELNISRTGRQMHVGKVFDGYFEIVRSVDTLKLIESYVSKFPARNASISRERHLQFFYESYLHEIYVLQQRLLRYLRTIERQYRSDSRLPEIRTWCKKVFVLVQDSLRSIVKVRGSHVHEIRAYDKGIDRLVSLGLLADPQSDSTFHRAVKVLFQEECRKVQKEWKARMVNSNGTLQQLLDAYFKVLRRLIFEKDGSPKYPSRLKF